MILEGFPGIFPRITRCMACISLKKDFPETFVNLQGNLNIYRIGLYILRLKKAPICIERQEGSSIFGGTEAKKEKALNRRVRKNRRKIPGVLTKIRLGMAFHFTKG